MSWTAGTMSGDLDSYAGTPRRVVFGAVAFLIGVAGLAALLAGPLGIWPGLLIAAAVQAAAVVCYLELIRPRQVRWGATDEEIARPMPGDDIAGPGARCTTRAVTIRASAGQVWPLLARPGKAPSQGQQGSSSDQSSMLPGPGFDLVHVDHGRYFVACSADQAMSWCLELEPIDQHSCRLISRWHARQDTAPASAPWTVLSDPSSYSTDRRMLLTIKAQAEHSARPGLAWRHRAA